LKDKYALDEIIEAFESLYEFGSDNGAAVPTDLTNDDDDSQLLQMDLTNDDDGSQLDGKQQSIHQSTAVGSNSVDISMSTSTDVLLHDGSQLDGKQQSSHQSTAVGSNSVDISLSTSQLTTGVLPPPIPFAREDPTKNKEARIRFLLNMIGAIDYMVLNVLGFIHPHLHYIVSRSLSKNYEPKVCRCSPPSPCKCEQYILPRPARLPYSLYVRANFHKDGDVIPRSFVNTRVVWLAMFKDIAWKIDAFCEYSDQFSIWAAATWASSTPIFRDIWPTCTDAYERVDETPLWLMWARKNRCSCIYNLHPIRKLSNNEKVVLDWLEKHGRSKIQDHQHFRNHHDTQICYTSKLLWSTGQCLWSTYVQSSDVVVANEGNDAADDILDRSLKLHDITNAVSDEMMVVSHRVVTAVKESLRTLPPPLPSNHQDTHHRTSSLWSNRPRLNTIVTAKEVKVLPLSGARTELNVALNILLHTSRMAILQNYGNPEWAREVCAVWSDIVYNLNRATKANLLQLTKGYSASKDIINLMKERATSLYLYQKGNFFHVKFVEEFQVSISIDDTTDVIGNKLRSALQFHDSTGLYLFRIQFDVVGRPRDNIYIPLLLRKDVQCYHSAACIYMNADFIIFKLITRSLENLNDSQYIYCTYIWNRKNEKWSTPNWQPLPVDGKVFPCYLDNYCLYAIIIIPTRSQRTASNFSMFLNSETEAIHNDCTVKDQLSLNFNCHLSEKVLRSMACDLMSEFRFLSSKQSFRMLTASFISALYSYMEGLEYLSSQIQMGSVLPGSEILDFYRTITQGSPEVLHLIVSYENVNGPNRWVYMFLLKTDRKLVVLTRRCDPVREILKICASLKCFLDIILPSPISIQQILWRGGGQLCQGNSGYYAVKQLWKNASSIHRKSIGDRGGLGHYLHMISKLEADLEEDEDGDGVKTPSWILKEITVTQVEQLREKIGNVVIRAYNFSKFYIQDFLLND
jgi:hypothetical protein